MFKLRSFNLTLLASLLIIPTAEARPQPTSCNYETYDWNVRLKQAVDFRAVTKDYASLTHIEIDNASGCSICEEDQVMIELDSVEPFRVCHVIADSVESTLRNLIDAGVPIYKVEGYRVGRTRGPTDSRGNRTQYSNHAFGIAVDINPEHNGLYDRCLSFSPACRLIRGGPWRPEESDASIKPDGLVVENFKEAGLNWGGHIEGRQKDFMHFSPSGY